MDHENPSAAGSPSSFADDQGSSDALRSQLYAIGVLLLDAGASVTDVRSALESLSERLLDRHDLTIAVLPQLVIIGAPGGEAMILNSAGPELSFRQAGLARQLVQGLESGGIPADEIVARIGQVRASGRGHAWAGWTVGEGLVSTGLAALFRCPWWAIVLAVVVGALVGLMSLALDRLREAAAIMPFVAALVSTVLVGWVAGLLGVHQVPLFAVCAPIGILVPGALITNALLELTAADIVTGTSRLMQGVIMLAFMAAGIAAGAAATGLRIDSGTAALVEHRTGRRGQNRLGRAATDVAVLAGNHRVGGRSRVGVRRRRTVDSDHRRSHGGDVRTAESTHPGDQRCRRYRSGRSHPVPSRTVDGSLCSRNASERDLPTRLPAPGPGNGRPGRARESRLIRTGKRCGDLRRSLHRNESRRTDPELPTLVRPSNTSPGRADRAARTSAIHANRGE